MPVSSHAPAAGWKEKLPGLAALAVLVLLVVAIARRRARLGYLLFLTAVALGERWQEGRAKARLGRALAALPESGDRDYAS